MDSISKEEKVQWWENIECIINCKTSFEPGRAVRSLPSFLSSFLRCHKDIANLAGYFGHPWPNPSKIILSTCKTLSCLSACKTSASLLSSFLRYSKTLHTYFEYFWHIWPHSSKIIVSFKKKIVMLIAIKINFIPHFCLEILQSFCKLVTLSNLGRHCLAMPTKVNGINL